MPGFTERVLTWLDERYKLKGVLEPFLKHPVPSHALNPLFRLGWIAFTCFVIQIVTGIFLGLYYKPTTAEAYNSIKFIVLQVPLGSLIRSIHAWSANIMIAAVMLHLIHNYFNGAYKEKRELTWVVGSLLLFVTLATGFSGYLLPWDQLAYWATTIGLNIAGSIPLIGIIIQQILQGGPEIGPATLTRFYILHTVLLPGILALLIGLHVSMFLRQGVSGPFKEEVRRAKISGSLIEEQVEEKKIIKGEPFFPHFVLREAVVISLVIAAIIFLATYFPTSLLEPADPFTTPSPLFPEWYFLPVYGWLKWMSTDNFPWLGSILPKLLGVLVPLVLALTLIIFPFIDREKERHPLRRRIGTPLGIAAIVLAIYFSYYAIEVTLLHAAK